jgi:serine/threonine-protein phosphatase 2B catalytic subunit
MWEKPGKPNVNLFKEHLIREGPVTKKQVTDILRMVQIFLKKEANLVEVAEPVAVVGDIHG